MTGALERALAVVHDRQVAHIVVGGVAMAMHGYLRATADLDLLLRLTSDNTARAIKALTDLGFRPRESALAPGKPEPKGWIEARGLRVFSLVDPATPSFSVDLFGMNPDDFDAVRARAIRVPFGAVEAVVVGLADLISMKVAAGRPKDLDDVLHLESLAELSLVPAASS